ncbi:MAG: hypothetical protein C5B50_02270 [Verrucomicrobia bacterium]|nr:MAG: hypothetical protein C5B50_02270 [Verrucomicrobiota bacterium]
MAGGSLFLGALALGTFVLPWHWPISHRTLSLSHIYGFNNFVAWLWVGLMLVLLTAYGLVFGKGGQPSRLQSGLWEILPDGGKIGVNKRLRAACCAMAVLTLVVVTGWFAYLPNAYFGEAALFISRIEAMLLGLQPYRDFDFNFGPAMLYPSYWGCLLFHRYFSVEQIYGATLALHWVFGLYLFYFIVSRLAGNFARTAVFLLLAVPSLNISLGLNYTLLRFTLPIASLIALHRFVLFKVQSSRFNIQGCHSSGQRSEVRGQWSLLVALAAFLAPLINFAFSPEMGVVTWLGSAAYFAHLWITPLRSLTVCLASVAAALPAVVLLFSRSYFDSIVLYSGGGHNLPIFPAAHVLLLLAALFAVTPLLARIAVQHRDSRGALALALCMATGLLVVPALGRCDPGHVLYNGFGVLLLFLAALAQAQRGLFKAVGVIYAAVWTGLGFMSMWHIYGPLVDQEIAMRKTASSASPTATSGLLHCSKMLPIPSGYEQLLQFKNIGVPIPIGEDLERFLKLNGMFAPNHRFCPFREICTRPQLEERLADLRTMDLVILPTATANLSAGLDPVTAAKGDSAALSGILLFPVRLTPHKPAFDPLREIVTELNEAHFSLIGNATESYLILQRETGP